MDPIAEHIAQVEELPDFDSLEELSYLLRVSKYLLFNIIKDSSRYYIHFNIEKKNGGNRAIDAPLTTLKGIQKWILRRVLDPVGIYLPDNATGFRYGYSIIDNAEAHMGNKFVLCLDIKDFFPSITLKRVFLLFRYLGYSNKAAFMLSKLCTRNGVLPQGAPTSPAISNLVVKIMDKRIDRYCKTRGLSYSRYADDMSISGNNIKLICKARIGVGKIVNDEEFKINSEKTRIMGPGMRKLVTGLIVHDDKVSVGRRKYRTIRSMIYHYNKLENDTDDKKMMRMKIYGYLSFIKPINRRYYVKLISRLPESEQKLFQYIEF